MCSILIILVAAAVVLVLIPIGFKVLWKVPRADEAPIVTGLGVKGAPARRAEVELGDDGRPTAQAVEDLIANRNELAQETRDASVPEMQKLGLVVDSLQIQDIIDPSGYIAALGEPRTAEEKMQARIAQAAADREATEREQEAEALKAAAQRDTALKLAG